MQMFGKTKNNTKTCINDLLGLIMEHVHVYTTTVFIRIVATATINFALPFVRLLIEGGSYSRAATITARQYRARARTRNNSVRTYVYERSCPPYDIAL